MMTKVLNICSQKASSRAKTGNKMTNFNENVYLAWKNGLGS